MPVDTRTMPGTLTRGEDGEEVASGWVLITYEMVGDRRPLTEWRGEMAVAPDQRGSLDGLSDGLYLRLKPYGGVFEPWHGPVSVELVSGEDDPNGRRLRLRSAGPMTRSLYPADEAPADLAEQPMMLDEATARQG